MTQDELNLVLDALKFCHGGEPCGTAEAIAVVEKTLAQPEQEPIYQYQRANGSWIDQTKESHDYNVRHGQATVRVVHTAPPQLEQEPVAFYNPQQGGFYWAKPTTINWPQTVKATPLAFYAHSQRTWVGLTRTQMQDVYFEVLKEHRGGHQMEGQLAFGEALQNKIREKNT